MTRTLDNRVSNFRQLAVTAFLIIFASSSYAADVLVGSDGGSVSVGNSGQAAWSIPIKVPAGVNGVTPSLGLSVSSSGGNGAFGVGGGLSGLSAITRCAFTVDQDQYSAAPQYLQSDAYCLDGARLLSTDANTYGDGGSVYRTEVESFRRITAHGSVAGTGPAYFVVEDSSGTVSVYGQSGDSKTVDPVTSAVSTWKIDSYEDVNGNDVDYQYADVDDSPNTQEVQLKKLVYGQDDELEIELVYATRPDQSSRWSRGQEYHLTKRVTNVQTKVGGVIVRNYKVEYEQGALTNASRISKVTECAGNNDCYRPSKLTYEPERSSDWESASIASPGKVQNANGKPIGLFVDINNDGKTDWITAYKDATDTILATKLGTETNWVASPQFELNGALYDYSQSTDGAAVGQLADVNGDGWLDYINAYSTPTGSVINTYRNIGTGFVLDPSLAMPVPLSHIAADGTQQALAELVDINGDGLVDVVQSVVLGDGSTLQQTFLHAVSGSTHSWAVNTDYQPKSIAVDYSQTADGQLFASLIDINSDGLPDWVQSYKQNNVAVNNTWLNTGLGFAANTSYSLPVALYDYDLHSDGVAAYQLVDFNHDGLLDLNKAISVDGVEDYDAWIHNGVGWFQDNDYHLPAPVQIVAANGNSAAVGGLVDLDSDGHADLVISYQSTTATVQTSWLFNKTNKSWAPTTEYSYPFPSNRVMADGTAYSVAQVADLDHDGFAELLTAIEGEVDDVYVSNNGDNGVYPGTLVEYQGSLGAITKLVYGVSKDATLYTPSAHSDYPNVAYNRASMLIREIQDENDIAGFNSTFYQYGLAKTNVRGRGYLGFGETTVKDGNAEEGTEIQVVTEYHQEYPFIGLSKSSRQFYDSITYGRSENTYAVLPVTIAGLTTDSPYLDIAKSWSHDEQGRLLSVAIYEAEEFDGFGNLKKSSSTVKKADDLGSYARKTTTETTHRNTESSWKLGLATVVKQTIESPNLTSVVNETHADYDDDGRLKWEEVEPNHAKKVRQTYTYHANGVPNTSTVTAVNQTPIITTYTPSSDGRFIEKIENTLSHKVVTKYYPGLGRPEVTTDPNGIMTEYLYDSLGTLIRESKKHESNDSKRGRQIVMPRWCDDAQYAAQVDCSSLESYFVTIINNQGDAPQTIYYSRYGKELRRKTLGFGGREVVVERKFDRNGRIAAVTQPYFTASSTEPADTKLWTEFSYDRLGRQETTTIRRDGTVGSNFLRQYQTIYDGLSITSISPANETTNAEQRKTIVYNIFGQPVRSTDENHIDGDSVTRYDYDIRGQLEFTTVENPGGADSVTQIEYDPVFGRKEAITTPDSGRVSYAYNALGQLEQQTDAKDQVTAMGYDVLGRIETLTDDQGGTQEGTTNWFYDGTGPDNIIGALRRVESPNYSRDIKYDEFSRAKQVDTNIFGEAFTQKRGYLGTSSKVDWISFPSDLSVRHTYDEYGFPKTVEEISLDESVYATYQAAAAELNNRSRTLEDWKEANLSDAELYDLEKLEEDVAKSAKLLGEFYDKFAGNAEAKTHKNEADRYDALIDKVLQKITQHSNWRSIYAAQFNPLYDIVKAEYEIQRDLLAQQLPHVNRYNELVPILNFHNSEKARYDTYKQSYLSNHNTAVSEYNTIRSHAITNQGAIEYHIKYVFRQPYADNYIANPALLAYDRSCCYAHITTARLNPGVTATDVVNSFGHHDTHKNLLNSRLSQMAAIQLDIDSHLGQYNHYSWRVTDEHNKALAVSAEMGTEAAASDGFNALYLASKARAQPSEDRTNNWLAPIIESHSNVIVAFNDRATLYAKTIAQKMGSYAKRSDLKAENFLKPFEQHFNYLRCLRDEPSKASGLCYAENLVFDSDAATQASLRAKIPEDYNLSVPTFYRDRRFFCTDYEGYNCAAEYDTEISQLALTIDIEQCKRYIDDENRPIEARAVCDSSITAQINLPADLYGYRSFAAITNYTTAYFNLVNRHESKVSQIVTTATADTYTPETDYDAIVDCQIWRVDLSTCSPAGSDITDNPNDYVLIKKGEIQDLEYDEMNAEERLAAQNLLNQQLQVANVYESAETGSYASVYRAVGEQLDVVTGLYNNIDSEYADSETHYEYENSDKKVFWQAENISARGQVKINSLGNGLSTYREYGDLGEMLSHTTKKTGSLALVNTVYQYDAAGNLTNRDDKVDEVIESFTYDQLNRLRTVQLSGNGTATIQSLGMASVSYEYDVLGNITYKSDINGGGTNGRYTYGASADGNAGPHAVSSITSLGSYSYDANGNQVSGTGRTIDYTPFNKAKHITNNGKVTELFYGAEEQLIRQVEDTDNSSQKTTNFIGEYYEETTLNGVTTQRHHITALGQTVAVIEKTKNTSSAREENYLHRDHLGSVVAITDEQGNLVEKRHFDAFGKVRSLIGESQLYALGLPSGTITDLGYTGHQQLGASDLTYMKARVYDPMIGRFTSADTIVPNPLSSQDFNRYSYVLNNPLAFTDPTGHACVSQNSHDACAPHIEGGGAIGGGGGGFGAGNGAANGPNNGATGGGGGDFVPSDDCLAADACVIGSPIVPFDPDEIQFPVGPLPGELISPLPPLPDATKPVGVGDCRNCGGRTRLAPSGFGGPDLNSNGFDGYNGFVPNVGGNASVTVPTLPTSSGSLPGGSLSGGAPGISNPGGGSSLLDFANSGFGRELTNLVPGVELARALTADQINVFDVALGAFSVIPGGGKAVSLGIRGVAGIGGRIGRLFGGRATKGVDPSTIRFTQSSVGNTIDTPNGKRPLRKLVKDLTGGRTSADDLPPIRVFDNNGVLTTLDNRRLKAFQVAGKPINTVPATAKEIANDAFKFSSKNGGTSVKVRVGGL